MEQRLEQRMYTLTNMYFMGIQAGIQALHAVARYANEYGQTQEYKDWVTHDETVICLSGGFSNDNESWTDPNWGMNYAFTTLNERDYAFATFNEKMANNCLSGIAFLVDGRVWDKRKYPDPVVLAHEVSKFEDFEDHLQTQTALIYGEQVAWMRRLLKPYPLAK